MAPCLQATTNSEVCLQTTDSQCVKIEPLHGNQATCVCLDPTQCKQKFLSIKDLSLGEKL